MTAPRTIPKVKISETDFTRQILDLASWHHWRTAHFRPAMTAQGWRTPVQGDGAGFPDCVLLRGNRAMVAELKVPDTKTVQQLFAAIPGWRARVEAWRESDMERDLFKSGQVEWLAAFDAARCETYVWVPEDWDLIVRLLR